ncbi:MAG: VCBS repeat-containing protein [Bacteroidetes bacterium]|nr:VCBS repeat-containing protein [Bacteroidota bacterium]
MKNSILIISYFLLFSAKIISQSGFCFAPATAYNAGDNHSVVSGDFNNDGIKDIATTNEGGGTQSGIVVMYGIGNGTFGASNSYLNGGVNARSITSADFNNDGIADIAAPNGSGYISVFLGTNTGTLSPMILSPGGFSGSNGIAAGDFNNDNKMDLAVTNSGSNGTGILLGLGTGSFSAQSIFLFGYQSSDIVCSDFDGDGNKDLATTNDDYNGSISVVLGNGTGDFTGNGTNYFSYAVDPRPQSLCTKDFNGDGKNDLAVTSGYSGIVSVFLSSSSGLFFPKVDYPITSGSTLPTLFSIASADFNGDHILDLAVRGYEELICFGSGGGVFGSPTPISTTPPSTISAGVGETCTDDFDGDMKPDLVLTAGNNNTVLVLLHCIPTPLSVSTTVTNALCLGACNGMAMINISGGVPTYTIQFSNIATYTTTNTFSVSGLCAGNYSYTVTDDLASSISGTLAISEPTQISFITFMSSPTVCPDICDTLKITSVSGGTPPYNYVWSPNISSSSINIVCSHSSIPCSATVVDANNCSVTQTLMITVNNCVYDSIWPGDANGDSTVNNLDVLELGLHYMQTGSARTYTSNLWQPYSANNWSGTVSNGRNLKHSDCNGDGIIDAGDTLAIYSNYNNIHFYKQINQLNTNPELTIVPDQPSVLKGHWGSASVFLGDQSNPVSNINGIAYTVYFGNSILAQDSIYIEYSHSSFMNLTGGNLNFQKSDFVNGNIYTATTHTNNINANGYGKIATLHYKIRDDLSTDEQLYVLLTNVYASSNLGIITPLSGGWTLIDALGASVGVKSLVNGSSIRIFPNPANNYINIQSSQSLGKIEVCSVTGEMLFSEMPTSLNCKLDLTNLSNGIYFMNVYQNNRIVKREKIVLNK